MSSIETLMPSVILWTKVWFTVGFLTTIITLLLTSKSERAGVAPTSLLIQTCLGFISFALLLLSILMALLPSVHKEGEDKE